MDSQNTQDTINESPVLPISQDNTDSQTSQDTIIGDETLASFALPPTDTPSAIPMTGASPAFPTAQEILQSQTTQDTTVDDRAHEGALDSNDAGEGAEEEKKIWVEIVERAQMEAAEKRDAFLRTPDKMERDWQAAADSLAVRSAMSACEARFRAEREEKRMEWERVQHATEVATRGKNAYNERVAASVREMDRLERERTQYAQMIVAYAEKKDNMQKRFSHAVVAQDKMERDWQAAADSLRLFCSALCDVASVREMDRLERERTQYAQMIVAYAEKKNNMQKRFSHAVVARDKMERDWQAAADSLRLFCSALCDVAAADSLRLSCSALCDVGI
uniref:Uncharacterized protein n=1 Tax=Chromera velia CCMP2878 TaxID=1169474 RepID=A0A0G4H6D3_9ALVE|eukprot:Cvel_24876.t1-p1 / transcript=Cvel_24876.t1 / gene=Cvel_24876 / organism=Chromera_velia_CCMP2878 / gene_product=hypothetical protein / transcript_product=hypothetical protein / location=Cvel_scaffold2749:10355-11471(-) / protein_length=333 / sequence_SO=supercontig / SO=protein_coding / is_pseudo=false